MELESETTNSSQQANNASWQPSLHCRKDQAVVVVLMVSVAITGTFSNFTGRMRAGLLKEDNFAASVPDALIQFFLHLTCLGISYSAGSVTKEQMKRALRVGRTWSECGVWKLIALAACNEALNYVTGLASQPYLTTLMMALMDQATTPFTVACSLALLGTRYTAFEIVSVLEVAVAAVLCVLIPGGESSRNSPFWAAFAALTTSFAAVSIVLKEMAFRSFREESARRARQLQGDLASRSSPGPCCDTQFASGHMPSSAAVNVSSFPSMVEPLSQQDAGRIEEPEPVTAEAEGPQTSASNAAERSDQHLNVFLLSSISGAVNLLACIPAACLNQLLTRRNLDLQGLTDGIHHIFSDWQITQVYLITVVVGFLFSLSMLILTSRASALLSFLTLKLVVPLVALMSPLPWPIIGAEAVDGREWGILFMMMCGIAAFRIGNLQRERRGLKQCCWPLKFGV